MNTTTQGNARSDLPFEIRAASALGISVVADALDYVGAPIFAMPVIGDIADAIVVAILYRLTGSKTSTFVNAIEFIPFVGDFVPTYTLTTLAWIIREIQKRNGSGKKRTLEPSTDLVQTIPENSIAKQHTIHAESKRTEDLRTKIFRRYAVTKSKAMTG